MGARILEKFVVVEVWRVYLTVRILVFPGPDTYNTVQALALLIIDAKQE